MTFLSVGVRIYTGVRSERNEKIQTLTLEVIGYKKAYFNIK